MGKVYQKTVNFAKAESIGQHCTMWYGLYDCKYLPGPGSPRLSSSPPQRRKHSSADVFWVIKSCVNPSLASLLASLPDLCWLRPIRSGWESQKLILPILANAGPETGKVNCGQFHPQLNPFSDKTQAGSCHCHPNEFQLCQVFSITGRSRSDGIHSH